MNRLIILVVNISILITFSELVAQESVLNAYVLEGLENNLALKQKYQSYEKSLQALKEARGLFLPDVSFNARFSVAQGGRSIELPIGDLMNPVYSSLNGITRSMAMAGQIPITSIYPDTSISNQNIDFLRPTEHETKFRLVQPVVNTQIWNNYKIKKELINIEKADADVYKRQLIADIKTAYFSYLKTIKVNELLNNTTELINENLRVNQKLFDNDKITYDIVLRAKAEVNKIEQQKAEAFKNQQMTRAYFNFLLNKPLQEEVTVSEWEQISLNNMNAQTASSFAIANREELKVTSSYANVADHNIKRNKGNNLPTIAAIIDYGLQGDKYDFNNIGEQDYMIASVILKWNLFTGFQNKSKTAQAKIDRQIIDNQYKALQEQVKLQVLNAFYDLEASQKKLVSTESEVESLARAFMLVNKKYELGKASLLELIDARTTMTNARNNKIIAQYDYLIKMAEFEKVTASLQIDK